MTTRFTRISLIVLADAPGTTETRPSGKDYRAELSMLLPRGKAWTRILTSNLQKLLSGLAKSFDRVDTRAQDLLLEMDPRTAVETLPDWERVTQPYGDGVAPTSIEARQAAVTSVIVSRGGFAGSIAVEFFEQLAAGLGYELEVRRFHRPPFNCMSQCTASLNTADAGWYFVWEFIALSVDDEQDALLETRIRKYAGAHLAPTFAFPLLDLADATFTRASTAVLTDPSNGTATALSSGQLGALYHGV